MAFSGRPPPPRAKSLVSDADEKLKDRIALAEMKDRQKNAQAVDRAVQNHQRMHKEIAECRQVCVCVCGGGGGAAGTAAVSLCRRRVSPRPLSPGAPSPAF